VGSNVSVGVAFVGRVNLSPKLFGQHQRLPANWIVAVAVLVYGYTAVGNAIANRGRHIGWMLMAAVVALLILGR
jgi:hypothetical protein